MTRCAIAQIHGGRAIVQDAAPCECEHCAGMCTCEAEHAAARLLGEQRTADRSAAECYARYLRADYLATHGDRTTQLARRAGFSSEREFWADTAFGWLEAALDWWGRAAALGELRGDILAGVRAPP